LGSGRGEWIASAALLGVVLVIGLATARNVGVTVDEYLFDGYGPKALSWYLSLGADRALFDHFDNWLYGPWFQIVTAIVQSFDLADRLVVRHALTFLVGLAGLAAIVPIGRRVIGPWAGFAALALCLLTGNLYGHLFFTPNDVPFMAAMNWALLAIIVMAEKGVPTWRMTLTAGACCGLAIATRIGGVLAQAYLVAAMGLLCLDIVGRREPASWTPLIQIALRTAAALAIGWVVTIILWPYLQDGNPLQQFLAAYRHFGTLKLAMTAPLWGHDVSTIALPWYYVPAQLAARLPELFIALLLAALGFGLAAAVALFRTLPGGFLPACRQLCVRLADARAMLLITTAALLPIVFVIATKASLYDGIRHLLFTLPPLALLAAWALVKLAPVIRRFAIPFGAVAAVQIAAAVYVMVNLHPLEYAATNVFAGWTPGSYGNFELDYWTAATTPALRRLEARIAQEPRDASQPPPRVMICINWRENMVGVMFHHDWRVAETPQDADYIIEAQRYRCAQGTAGKLIDEVTRFGVPFAWTYQMPSRGSSQ